MADATPDDSTASLNPLPDPAVFAAGAPTKAGKKKFKPGSMSASEVNINSLLDVLSVILVFLMKSYSANTVQIKPSQELQVPISHSMQQVLESTTVTVTLKNILVDDVPVMTFEEGKLAPTDIGGGGMLINPLFANLQTAVDHEKKIEARNAASPFKGIVTIIGDRNVSFELMTQVMYTAGQAQFSKFKFAAIKMERY